MLSLNNHLCTLCNATPSPPVWKVCHQSFIFLLHGTLENSLLPCYCFTTARQLACQNIAEQNCLFALLHLPTSSYSTVL